MPPRPSHEPTRTPPDQPHCRGSAGQRHRRRPGHALAKEALFELVFPGEADVQTDAIEVVAYRLRKKLAATAARLVTLRGLGYLLKAEA